MSNGEENEPGVFSARNADEEGKQEIWVREEERWELTWPIWHMLPRGERKLLAHKYGYDKIGDFEEYMVLQRGLTDSTESSAGQRISNVPYDNSLAYPPEEEPSEAANKGEEDDDDDQSDSDEKLEAALEAERAELGDMSTEELMRVGGKLLLLPEEMLHRIFAWLPVDTYAKLALVSPHWKSFTRTEAVYKKLCERLYLNQSKRRALHVGRFGNSYRTMLEKRPRVRAGGGVYVMKYSQVKKIQRDMWTEIPAGAILEMTYYRYIYFQEDGRVLYALTPTAPHEMFVRFRKVCLDPHNHEDPTIVLGTYQVQKTHVTVHAKQQWQYVQLEMTIQPQYLYHGRWGYLSFDRHMSSASNNFEEWSMDRVQYDVPEEPFRFVPDKRL
eukprot:CAMPEP_0172453046 /NCGR_PEP_ID=MMETSP1065-20121228/10524_1 /TAXON_ID=265537 /ORGANISM="Amphiprora paludosa, Strain CCMP125" /LENGTH=384 /DNA_ID=CAMNT_0013205205 /DNA_START=85 /DNA_END=1239 /DNA_ORIENTATION=+